MSRSSPLRTPSTAITLAALSLSLTACNPPASPAEGAASTTAAAQSQASSPSVLTVNVVTPTTEPWPQAIQANGNLAPWQEIIVAPETGGLRIAELLVDVGARVKRGQLLARLADDSLRNSRRKQQALVAEAEANLEQAVSNVRRAKMVETTGGLSAQSIEQYRISEATSRASLASAKADLAAVELQLRQTRIVAPDDGTVSSKTAALGNVIAAGTEMFRMVRQSRVEWQAEVDAKQLGRIEVGQPATVTLPGGGTTSGQVRLIGPVLSTDTGRATVYVSLSADSPARVGMFVSGTLALGVQPALSLPQSALVARDGRDYVYLLGDDHSVQSAPVTVGRRQQGRVELLGGLAANAQVVASGGAFLSDGVKVTVAHATKAASSASQ